MQYNRRADSTIQKVESLRKDLSSLGYQKAVYSHCLGVEDFSEYSMSACLNGIADIEKLCRVARAKLSDLNVTYYQITGKHIRELSEEPKWMTLV